LGTVDLDFWPPGGVALLGFLGAALAAGLAADAFATGLGTCFLGAFTWGFFVDLVAMTILLAKQRRPQQGVGVEKKWNHRQEGWAIIWCAVLAVNERVVP
jgi:hypothetical protein